MNPRLTAKNLQPAEIIQLLQLKPHPEGGFYREVYRADGQIGAEALPERYGGPRSFSTAIYYMITGDTFSTMHIVKSDEVFHFYSGDPVEQLRLHPDGSSEIVILGQDFAAGHQPQSLVPRGVWQGARLCAGGSYALMGATVAPGFDFADYEEGFRDKLIAEFPQHQSLITALTRR